MPNNPITAGASSYHGTTTIGSVDVVTLDRAYAKVEVINRDTATDLWVTLDRGATNQTTLTPTIAGAGTRYVGAGAARVLTDDTAAQGAPASTVRVTSAAACPYSVTGHDAL